MNTTKKTKKLNIYAKNFNYISDEEARPYLSKLTNFLGDNEWLKSSREKFFEFDNKKIFDNKTLENKMIGMKPSYVSWFSKGSWLFHDIGLNIDNEIIYITVDYNKNIFRIANKSTYSNLMTNDQYKSQLSKFNKKYIAIKRRNKLVPKGDKYASCDFSPKKFCEEKSDFNFNLMTKVEIKPKCKWNKKTKKCNFLPCSREMKENNKCEISYSMPFYNWFKFFNEYDGLAIYPMMTTEEMENIENHHGFMGWDVETLVLSNSEPIIKHHNLGTIRELLNIPKKSDEYINYNKLVSKLIQKINEVRKL
jgi:hypothetical protein